MASESRRRDRPRRMRLSLAGAVLAAALVAGCAEEPELVATPICSPDLPPGTTCIDSNPYPDGKYPEAVGVGEPDIVIEEPTETDYEGPRALE